MIAPDAARAGAWTLPEGEGQIIVSALHAAADRRFDDRGGTVAAPRFSKAEATVFGEYGLADGFTAIAQGEVAATAVGEPLGFDAARFGVGALGGRLRLWQGGGSVLSAEITGRLAPDEIAAAGTLPFEASADLRLLAGHSFTLGGMPAFVDGAVAYRLGIPLDSGVGNRADEVRLDLSLGIRPRPDWLLLAQSFGTFELGGGPAGDARQSHKIQLSAVYALTERLSLQLGALATVAGADALAERGIVSALWIRLP